MTAASLAAPTAAIRDPSLYAAVDAIAQGEVDLYRFEASAGSILIAETSSVGVGMDTYLRLFDAAGNELARNDDGGVGLYSLIE